MNEIGVMVCIPSKTKDKSISNSIAKKKKTLVNSSLLECKFFTEFHALCQVLRLLEGDQVVESAFTMDTIANKSCRMSGVRVQELAEPGRSQSARLSNDTLKEIYVVKERQPMQHTRMFLG